MVLSLENPGISTKEHTATYNSNVQQFSAHNTGGTGGNGVTGSVFHMAAQP